MLLTRGIAHIFDKVNNTARGLDGRFPHYTEIGQWETSPHGYWTGGFWVGVLWLAYILTSEDRYRKYALEFMEILKPRKDAPDANFDLGFLFYPSFVLGYKITGDKSMRTVALEAAERLIGFFHQQAGLIYHIYQDRRNIQGREIGSSIIDVMMNLSLLWWAYSETGERRYFEVAYNHSKKSAELFVREGGSTFQVVDFDLKTGGILRKGTIHGFSDGSCWSRGQAWGIYGFILAYKFSKDPLFWKVVERLSRYYILNSPQDHIPYWDFKAPSIPDAPRDTSAAAIACAGWKRLQGLREAEVSDIYLKVSANIWDSLVRHYLQVQELDGLLSHGCAYLKRGRGVNEATIWGDYYFLESMVDERYKV